jgi:solute carrier family 25 2-oxodicarboxylate transporter 21
MFGTPETKGTVGTKAIAAAVASLPEGFTIQPIEVSKIALQLDKEKKYNNKAGAVIKDILAKRGWTGLFIGYFGIQYRQTSWTAAYFATLQFFTEGSANVLPADWKMTQNLVGGFAAGMFGAIFNTPGDVIRSSQQKLVMAQTPVRHPFSVGLLASGVTDFFKMGGQIYSTKGLGGLYSGFGFKALHLGGSGALLAMLIPMFKGLFGVK